jgi:hypothetical protein
VQPLKEILNSVDADWVHSVNSMRRSLRHKLENIDRTAPEALSVVVSCLLKAQFDQTEIADCCGFNRTTVSRWSQNLNIPRSPIVRSLLIEKMLELADKGVEPAVQRRPRGNTSQRRKKNGSRKA